MSDDRVLFNPQSLRNVADLMDEVPFPSLESLSPEAKKWFQLGWKSAIECLRVYATEAEKDWEDVGGPV